MGTRRRGDVKILGPQDAYAVPLLHLRVSRQLGERCGSISACSAAMAFLSRTRCISLTLFLFF